MCMMMAGLAGGCSGAEEEPLVDGAPVMGHCGRSAPPDEGVDPLARARYSLVATWLGTASSPWVPPYTVEMTFAADGTYEAHTVDHSAGWMVSPFYWGHDPEYGLFKLVAVKANGDVSGTMSIDSSQTIDAVRFDEDLTHLHFEYRYFGDGSIVYELDCGP